MSPLELLACRARACTFVVGAAVGQDVVRREAVDRQAAKMQPPLHRHHDGRLIACTAKR